MVGSTSQYPSPKASPQLETSGCEFLQRGSRKLAWMLALLIAPELLVGVALMLFISARTSFKQMVRFSEQDGTEWAVIHGFFANMGGFVVRFSPETPLSPPEDLRTHRTNDEITPYHGAQESFSENSLKLQDSRDQSMTVSVIEIDSGTASTKGICWPRSYQTSQSIRLSVRPYRNNASRDMPLPTGRINRRLAIHAN